MVNIIEIYNKNQIRNQRIDEKKKDQTFSINFFFDLSFATSEENCFVHGRSPLRGTRGRQLPTSFEACFSLLPFFFLRPAMMNFVVNNQNKFNLKTNKT